MQWHWQSSASPPTATTAELNILDGVTATASEINLLDGITALAFGTYTPTISDVANTYSNSASVFQYMRIGNVVTVSGKIAGTNTDPTDSSVSLTLPVASTFSTDAQCAGVMHVLQTGATPTNSAGKVYCSASSGTVALVAWRAIAAGGTYTGYVTFTYQVL